jgi:glycosyltransferase involved in cell wall biosynthesis
MTVRVAFLEGRILDYRVPFLTALRARVDALGVFAWDISNATREALSRVDIEVHALQHVSFKRTWRHPAGFAEPLPLVVALGISSALASYQPTVVVSGDLGVRTMAAARFCARDAVPLVLWIRMSEHSEQGRSRAQRLARPLILRRASRLIVNGTSGRDYLRSIGAPANRIEVVHQALNPAAVAPVADRRSTERTELLAIGRLVQSKGLHLLFRSLNSLPRHHWRLTVAGDGYLRQRLQQQANDYQLPIEFVGMQPPAELARLLSQADYLVHPSLSDEWALVVGEALASGVPVLGSVYAQAVTELVRDNVNGWTFRPCDHHDVLKAVDWATGVSPARWRELSAAARASADHLRPNVIADSFAHVLHEAADERRTADGRR